uniref:Uncharacterized protein n=1 Tax=Tanacetum cinerariifolium TaxID=118510 RepID=A0A699GIW8_TANCI|nr:hypothetical protein [Tanacetum cinerariifolium]
MGVLKAVRKAHSASSNFSDQEARFSPRRERPHEIDAPYVENLANSDGILRHFIPLRYFSLTLTSVTRFDQVMGIMIDCGPVETGVRHLFGGVVRAMMSPGGSIMASLNNINGFLAVNTPPDDLIHTDLKQEGVVPKLTLHVFKEFVLLLGRHPFNNKVPRMVKDNKEKDKIRAKPDKIKSKREA